MAAIESVAQSLPYNVAVVDFPRLPGVRLITNVVNVKPGELAIGDRVSLAWEDAGDGIERSGISAADRNVSLCWPSQGWYP